VKTAFYSALYPAVIAFVLGIAVGELHGRRQGERSTQRTVVYSSLPGSVQEYRALQRGDTRKAEIICGQRIWSYVSAYDEDFASDAAPSWFTKYVPEARQLVGAVSNQEMRDLFGTNMESIARLRDIFGNNAQVSALLTERFGTNVPVTTNKGK